MISTLQCLGLFLSFDVSDAWGCAPLAKPQPVNFNSSRASRCTNYTMLQKALEIVTPCVCKQLVSANTYPVIIFCPRLTLLCRLQNTTLSVLSRLFIGLFFLSTVKFYFSISSNHSLLPGMCIWVVCYLYTSSSLAA